MNLKVCLPLTAATLPNAFLGIFLLFCLTGAHVSVDGVWLHTYTPYMIK